MPVPSKNDKLPGGPIEAFLDVDYRVQHDHIIRQPRLSFLRPPLKQDPSCDISSTFSSTSR
eukprot:8640524-Pyramimonas_sp.AAC.1